jgi:hypothetical protein
MHEAKSVYIGEIFLDLDETTVVGIVNRTSMPLTVTGTTR